MDISYHNNDIILKYMSEAFKDAALEFYGLHTPKIKAVVPTELPVLEVSENTMDFVFLLEDDTYLHLEFQTTVKEDDLYRFMLYDARVLKKYYKKVRTAVVYSGEIASVPASIDGGSINYNVENIYMNHYDGNTTFENLKVKVDNGEEITQIDILNFVFLPLMKNIFNRNEAAISAIALASKIKNQEQKQFCVCAILGIADKFLDKEYVKRLEEVLRMNKIVAELNRLAVERALEEERQATAKKLEEALDAERQMALKKVEKEKLEVARNLLLKGLDILLVTEVTGLNLDVIRKLSIETVK